MLNRLQQAVNAIRAWFARLGGILITWWQSLTDWLRRASSAVRGWFAEGGWRTRIGEMWQAMGMRVQAWGAAVGQRLPARLREGAWRDRVAAAWRATLAWLRRLPGRTRTMAGSLWQRFRGDPEVPLWRRIWQLLRQAWAGLAAFALWLWGEIRRLYTGRRSRRPAPDPDAMVIRKVGVGRKYTLLQDVRHQWQADLVNASAVLLGVALAPLLLDPVSGMGMPGWVQWILGFATGFAALAVAYRRWRAIHQERGRHTVDLLTAAILLIGAVVVVSTLARVVSDVTPRAQIAYWGPTLLGMPALLFWLWVESHGVYALLVRRPYTPDRLLILVRGILFMAAALMLLLFLGMLGAIPWIELTFAAYLFWLGAILAAAGLLFSAAGLLLQRRSLRPAPAS